MSQAMPQVKVVMLGAGHLGSLILKAWIKNKIVLPKNIHVYVKSKASLRALKKSLPKISIGCEEAGDKIPSGDIFVIAVKPQQWASIRGNLKTKLKKKSFVLSIMAGVLPSRLEADLGCPSVVVMTNTALQVNKALSTVYRSPKCSTAQFRWAQNAFKPFGMVTELNENQFAAATALGASHPAFALWILGEISKIVEEKLPSQNGAQWTEQIFSGALKLLSKKSVPELLTQIATPGGCTAEGLNALRELEVSTKLLNVFDRCQKKAEGLGK